MKYFVLFISLFCLQALGSAQSAHTLKREADQAYKKGDFQGSEEAYRKAQLEKKSSNGTFNLGNSIFQQERFEEAARQYEDLVNSPNASISDRADAYHNLGNTQFNLQQFDKSVDAFKESLKLNPKDMETKYNLAQALRQLKINNRNSSRTNNKIRRSKKNKRSRNNNKISNSKINLMTSKKTSPMTSSNNKT